MVNGEWSIVKQVHRLGRETNLNFPFAGNFQIHHSPFTIHQFGASIS